MFTTTQVEIKKHLIFRYFNQGTKFGGMLDQLTDRCGTMGLVAVLAHLYPKYMFPLLLSMCIDIACHWIYLHT